MNSLYVKCRALKCNLLAKELAPTQQIIANPMHTFVCPTLKNLDVRGFFYIYKALKIRVYSPK